MSFASVDSSTTSDSLSPSSSNNALYPRSPVSPVGGGVVRHSSMRSAMGDHEYHGNMEHMRGAPPPSDGIGSTPEVCCVYGIAVWLNHCFGCGDISARAWQVKSECMVDN